MNADLAVERHRDGQREADRDRHEQHRVDDRVPDRVAEHRVVLQRAVVGAARPSAAADTRSLCWKDSSSDQPIGTRPNSDDQQDTSRRRRRTASRSAWSRAQRARSRRRLRATARARIAFTCGGGLVERLLRLRLAQQHRLHRLPERRRDLRVRAASPGAPWSRWSRLATNVGDRPGTSSTYSCVAGQLRHGLRGSGRSPVFVGHSRSLLSGS